jgi:LPS-assembly protein
MRLNFHSLFKKWLLLQGLLALSFLTTASLALAQASAKIQGLLIEADSLTRDEDKGLVELDGHVQIVRETQHISADRARIYLQSKHIELYGRVRMISPQSTVGGDMVSLDYETNTGMIYNGFVQSGSVIFEGKTLQKIGDDEYFVSDADYTTCTNCPASWSFSGQRIRAELGGYAFIKSSILKFGGVPVLWLPYLIVPLKSDRQSGLLTPEFEQSSVGGFAYSQSFFWAINRSEDATLGLKNYEKRGLKGFANYRYVLAENSFGEFNSAFIRDNVFRNNERLNEFRPQTSQGEGINRWFLNYSHYYDLPHGYAYRALFNNASDLLYAKDFPLDTGNSGESALENRMSITKNEETTHWHIDGAYYINMLRADPLGGNNDAVHRLPEFSFSKTNTVLNDSNLIYSLDVSYVNFARNSKGYDDLTDQSLFPTGTTFRRHIRNKGPATDPTRQDPNCENTPGCQLDPDGKYDPYIDLLRTGQRLNIKPTLAYPIPVADGIDIFPKLTYQETQYTFDAGEDRRTVRRFFLGEVAGRATLSQVYGNLKDPLSNRILHEIQPELKYTRTPWIYRPRHPFFSFDKDADHPVLANSAITDDELKSQSGLQFDSNDRIYETDLLTLSFVNRWVEKKWIQNIPEFQQIALLKVSQSYNFYQASLSDPAKEPWSPILTELNIRTGRLETSATFTYHPTPQVTDTQTRLRLSNEMGQFFQLGLARQNRVVAGQTSVDSNQRVEDYSIAAGFLAPRLNFLGKFTYDGNWTNSPNNRKIKSWAYIAQFKPPGDCWLITLTHEQKTGGDTLVFLGLEFNWDGITPQTLPQEALDKYGS